jgi:hypothetical protein
VRAAYRDIDDLRFRRDDVGFRVAASAARAR